MTLEVNSNSMVLSFSLSTLWQNEQIMQQNMYWDGKYFLGIKASLVRSLNLFQQLKQNENTYCYSPMLSSLKEINPVRCVG